MTALRALPARRPPDGRAADGRLGLGRGRPTRPGRRPSEQARALTAFSPSALAAFARLRQGLEPVAPGPGRSISSPGSSTSSTARSRTRRPPARSTPTSSSARSTASTPPRSPRRVITSTRADIASAVCGAIGAMKGPLHGGAPSEVVEQIHAGRHAGARRGVGAATRSTSDERLMGFGHRVYRAYDPRAAALREVAEGDGAPARVAGARDRGRGRRAARAGREAPGPRAQDQRRVLRGARAHGRRASRRTCSRPRSRWRVTPAGPRTPSSRARTTG